LIDNFLKNNGLKDDDLLTFKTGLKPAYLKKGEYFVVLGQTSKHLATQLVSGLN
jgi:hypothetical protein